MRSCLQFGRQCLARTIPQEDLDRLGCHPLQRSTQTMRLRCHQRHFPSLPQVCPHCQPLRPVQAFGLPYLSCSRPCQPSRTKASCIHFHRRKHIRIQLWRNLILSDFIPLDVAYFQKSTPVNGGSIVSTSHPCPLLNSEKCTQIILLLPPDCQAHALNNPAHPNGHTLHE